MRPAGTGLSALSSEQDIKAKAATASDNINVFFMAGKFSEVETIIFFSSKKLAVVVVIRGQATHDEALFTTNGLDFECRSRVLEFPLPTKSKTVFLIGVEF